MTDFRGKRVAAYWGSTTEYIKQQKAGESESGFAESKSKRRKR
jgi:hypothetical protein